MASGTSSGTWSPQGSSKSWPGPTASAPSTVFGGSTLLSAAPLQHSGDRQAQWRTYAPSSLPCRGLFPAAAAHPARPAGASVQPVRLAAALGFSRGSVFQVSSG
ncbi:hypothetical protein NDU88_000945 [Pleurodeles waltl]|uniref:Uncharacterized protein n=1 Tax=Pleurodeles waltl TaxID=8319 RepID=A0AAV7TIR0_PLEWA|nr:hypothetical protein NDU88_000945 [Pleurodeles waltl]